MTHKVIRAFRVVALLYTTNSKRKKKKIEREKLKKPAHVHLFSLYIHHHQAHYREFREIFAVKILFIIRKTVVVVSEQYEWNRYNVTENS